MRRLLLAVVLLASIACKEKSVVQTEPPVKAVVAGLEMIDYEEPSGAFKILGPADWKVREDNALGPSVMLLGPGTQRFPRSVYISVSRYPNKADKVADPMHYYSGIQLIEGFRNVSPVQKRSFGDRQAQCYSAEKPFRKMHERKISYYTREDTAIIPYKGGFYEINHVAPVEIYKETLPVFEAVVASFKPGSTDTPKTP